MSLLGPLVSSRAHQLFQSISMATRAGVRPSRKASPMVASSWPSTSDSRNTRVCSCPAWLMMAPWNFSCPAMDCRIWKNRQVSAPWAMAW